MLVKAETNYYSFPFKIPQRLIQYEKFNFTEQLFSKVNKHT